MGLCGSQVEPAKTNSAVFPRALSFPLSGPLGYLMPSCKPFHLLSLVFPTSPFNVNIHFNPHLFLPSVSHKLGKLSTSYLDPSLSFHVILKKKKNTWNEVIYKQQIYI